MGYAMGDRRYPRHYELHRACSFVDFDIDIINAIGIGLQGNKLMVENNSGPRPALALLRPCLALALQRLALWPSGHRLRPRAGEHRFGFIYHIAPRH